MFWPVDAPRLKAPGLILGTDILSKLHLYIAYGEKTLYVTATGAGHCAAAAK